jgi:hypothetical protein
LDDEASALSYATAAIQIYEKMMDGSTVARSLDFRTKGLEFKSVQKKRRAYFAMLTSVMSSASFFYRFHHIKFVRKHFYQFSSGASRIA